ncbi:hypothetical protein [Streptomyces sp. NL15-2K]|uniref:hypothetical protein n=1 Tax=Streptomyces sp. NL15-2K TaxID=376149 RepID=UPI000F57B35D|nr:MULTISPECIES: hypothetical protein [Actinomycetes]WKX10543.1 hypothetical protein Q4V64_24750 [Kutzneria buriramensis]GCB47924.1 hypothetical protein SNL152K_5246 [Streptomyces sp. NL15-2K]
MAKEITGDVTRWDISAADLPETVLTVPTGDRVFLLPDSSIDGMAVYRDDVAGLIKTLRHRGVDIDFACAREDRRYLSEYGATEVVATIGIAVATTLTTDLVKSIVLTAWQRARSSLGPSCPDEEVDEARVTVKIAEIVRTENETAIRGLEITSRLADIENLIQAAVSDPARAELPPAEPDDAAPEDTTG